MRLASLRARGSAGRASPTLLTESSGRTSSGNSRREATTEAARAWVLRAFADVLASGVLLLGSVGAEYAARVITYEYAKHEAALLGLREESPLWAQLDAPPLRAEEIPDAADAADAADARVPVPACGGV